MKPFIPRTEADTDALITDYRHFIALRDAATLPVARADYDGSAARMRKQWAEWQGEDCLHEMAFGKTD